MAAREDLGSWLEGTPSGDGGNTASGGLGLPASGPGSLAPLGRRVPALLIDWLLCVLIAGAFFGSSSLYPLAVFAVENLLLVATIGTTIGHRLLGIRVRRAPAVAVPAGAPVDGGPVGLGRTALRTLAICLVVPAVVWDRDGRGLHDRAAGTVIVRR